MRLQQANSKNALEADRGKVRNEWIAEAKRTSLALRILRATPMIEAAMSVVVDAVMAWIFHFLPSKKPDVKPEIHLDQL